MVVATETNTREAVVTGKSAVVGKSGSITALQLQERIGQLETELNARFLERGDLVRGMLTMLIGKQNLFAGGAPGTGKTDLSKALAQAFTVDRFYYLVGTQTEPGHVLGPVDLKAMMENHEFKLNLAGMMADSHLAILDEGFKGNAPFLNSLLGLMLDHGIQNGRDWHESPLMSVVVCSNELPQSDRLAAFWDRLSLRYWVDDVSWANRETLMLRRAGLEKTPVIKQSFSLAELVTMQKAAASLPCSREAILLANKICKDLSDKSITLSTRKSVQLIDLMRAFAYVAGAASVEEEHVEILKHVLWSDSAQSKVIDPTIDALLEKAFEAVNLMLTTAKQLVQTSQNFPLSDKQASRRMHFEGVDSRLVELITKLERIVKNSPRSKRGEKAVKVKKAIQDLRNKHILTVLAEMEVNG